MTAGVTPGDLSRHAGGMASPRGGCGLPQQRPCRSEAGEDVNFTADDDRISNRFVQPDRQRLIFLTAGDDAIQAGTASPSRRIDKAERADSA